MDISSLLDLLLHGNQLKRTVRSGWPQRGVAEAESVADHSYGVGFIALMLAQLIAKPVDLGKLLIFALLHDLPEGLTSDIPAPALRFLPEGTKPVMERLAMAEIVAGVPFADRLMVWWEELQAGESIEAHLVHDADRLDMFIQATVYAAHTGNRQLAEFWDREPHFHFAEAKAIYEMVRSRGWPRGE